MGKKILIAEDDQDLNFLLKSALEAHGYVVTSAQDGMQALRLSKEDNFDLMIVDLTMPLMNGWKFAMKVRQEERYKVIPMIILSGLLERDADAQQFESATVYIAKPFDLPKLIDKIKAFLA